MICATCGRAHDATWRPRHPFSPAAAAPQLKTIHDELVAIGADPEKLAIRVLSDRIEQQRIEIARLLKENAGLKKSFEYVIALANKRATQRQGETTKETNG